MYVYVYEGIILNEKSNTNLVMFMQNLSPTASSYVPIYLKWTWITRNDNNPSEETVWKLYSQLLIYYVCHADYSHNLNSQEQHSTIWTNDKLNSQLKHQMPSTTQSVFWQTNTKRSFINYLRSCLIKSKSKRNIWLLFQHGIQFGLKTLYQPFEK